MTKIATARDSGSARYSNGAIALHWIIAICVVSNLILANLASELEGAAADAYMDPHKAIGMAVLALTVVRIVWRLTHRPPAMANTMSKLENLLARGVHVIFYVLLITIPLGGWIAGSYASSAVDFFGLFTIPTLPVTENFDTAGAIIDLHGKAGDAMMYLIGLHVLGALKHTFVDKNGGLAKMWPASPQK